MSDYATANALPVESTEADIEQFWERRNAEAEEQRKAEWRKQKKAEDDAQRMAWIESEIPASFLRFKKRAHTWPDSLTPPGVDAEASDAVFKWWGKYEERERPNLYLHGGTGSGKTFTGLSLIEYAAESYSGQQLERGAIMRTDGMTFQREVPRRVTRDFNDDSIGTLEDFIAPLRNAGVLFVDEADKLSGSERVALEFFALLNDRIERDVMTIIASFSSPAEFAQIFQKKGDKQLGLQVARRIADFFEIIEFKRGRTATQSFVRLPAKPPQHVEKEVKF